MTYKITLLPATKTEGLRTEIKTLDTGKVEVPPYEYQFGNILGQALDHLKVDSAKAKAFWEPDYKVYYLITE